MSLAVIIVAIPACFLLYLLVQGAYYLFRGIGAKAFDSIALIGIISTWLFGTPWFVTHESPPSPGDPLVVVYFIAYLLTAIVLGAILGFPAIWVSLKIKSYDDDKRIEKKNEEFAKKQAIDLEKQKKEPPKTDEQLAFVSYNKVVSSGIKDLKKIIDDINKSIEREKTDPVCIAREKKRKKILAKCRAGYLETLREDALEESMKKHTKDINKWN